MQEDTWKILYQEFQICKICRERRKYLIIHHITYFPELRIRICKRCHYKIHFPQKNMNKNEYDEWYNNFGIYMQYKPKDNVNFYRKVKKGEIIVNKKLIFGNPIPDLNKYEKELLLFEKECLKNNKRYANTPPIIPNSFLRFQANDKLLNNFQ